jgi:hypothetical protein
MGDGSELTRDAERRSREERHDGRVERDCRTRTSEEGRHLSGSLRYRTGVVMRMGEVGRARAEGGRRDQDESWLSSVALSRNEHGDFCLLSFSRGPSTSSAIIWDKIYQDFKDAAVPNRALRWRAYFDNDLHPLTAPKTMAVLVSGTRLIS